MSNQDPPRDSLDGLCFACNDVKVMVISDCCRGGGGQWPQRILYYRDGVADSQFDEVVTHELRVSQVLIAIDLFSQIY